MVYERVEQDFYTIYTAIICVGLRSDCFRAGAEKGVASRQIRRGQWELRHSRRVMPMRDLKKRFR